MITQSEIAQPAGEKDGECNCLVKHKIPVSDYTFLGISYTAIEDRLTPGQLAH